MFWCPRIFAKGCNMGVKYKKILIAKDSTMLCAGWAWISFHDSDEIVKTKKLFNNGYFGELRFMD